MRNVFHRLMFEYLVPRGRAFTMDELRGFISLPYFLFLLSATHIQTKMWSPSFLLLPALAKPSLPLLTLSLWNYKLKQTLSSLSWFWSWWFTTATESKLIHSMSHKLQMLLYFSTPDSVQWKAQLVSVTEISYLLVMAVQFVLFPPQTATGCNKIKMWETENLF